MDVSMLTTSLKNSAVLHTLKPRGQTSSSGGKDTYAQSFRGIHGATEHFFILNAPQGRTFKEQLTDLENQYLEILKSFQLDPETAIFRRIYLSDILNQTETVRSSMIFGQDFSRTSPTSIIQQPLFSGNTISLFAYHIDGPGRNDKIVLTPHHLIINRKGARQLWSYGLTCEDDSIDLPSPSLETKALFENLTQTLTQQEATLKDHCIRTWIYIKNLDLYYRDILQSRRDHFEQQGLTNKTHFIASTGTEGSSANRYSTISLDALSLLDLKPEQISYLNDFSRLCPTKDYNVTFERGTRIAYADRNHFYVSGTASIDNLGHVVHPGDVLLQAGRVLENIEALLESGGAGLHNLMYLIVYLRNAEDYALCEEYFARQCPHVPILFTQGRVCRPEWLIEAEAFAITANQDATLPHF
jgi:enamine deaminase RidA (YjgF/YER057c/UK114 family)